MNFNRLNLNILKLNEPLPEWSLESIFGNEIPSKEMYFGKPLLILFFSLGCPGCLGRAIPYANRVIYEKGDNLNVLGIHSNFEAVDFPLSKFEDAQSNYHIRFPFFKDRNYNNTFINYGAGGTPHWVLVDKDGKVDYSIFGSDPNNALLRLDYRIGELLG